MEAQQLCEKCRGPLDWRGRCLTCAQLERLRGTIAERGGFKAKREKRKGASRTGESGIPANKPAEPKGWNGPSGVDNALPLGDRE